MAQVPAQSFYLGPFAVYTSATGLTDPITGFPELGGTLHEGDYVDLMQAEAQQWNILYGSNLSAGRYRFVRVSPNATYSNFGFGYPVGWGIPTTVGQVIVSSAGSGGTAGTYVCSSSAAGGTTKATASVVINASGGIASAQLLNPGAGFTSVPTFSLSEITGWSGGSLLAQMAISPNFISSFDSSSIALSDVRGVALCTLTAAQITAGAWIVIQESGIAPLYVTTATSATVGAVAASATAAAVTTTVNTGAPVNGFIGYMADLPAASTVSRVILRLPLQQG